MKGGELIEASSILTLEEMEQIVQNVPQDIPILWMNTQSNLSQPFES